MTQLIGELDTKLEELEEMGAYVAAAHLQAAIESLRSHCKIEQTRSKPDEPARDGTALVWVSIPRSRTFTAFKNHRFIGNVSEPCS
jgi:hypothetical protein